MRIVAIVNRKGGTGKTTIAVNLGHGLALAGFKVLIVDVDPQGNVGICFGMTSKRTLYHLLIDHVSLKECIVEARENLNLILSDETLSRAEQLIFVAPNRERVLKESMNGIEGYDFILVDCAPSLSLLNQNALIYAKEVFIPISMEYLSLVGVKQVIRNLEMTRQYLNHTVELSLVIPTFYDLRNRKSKEVLENLKAFFKDRVAEPIRVDVNLSQAPSAGKTIFEYAPRSRGTEDYQRLVRRVIDYG